MENDIRPRHSHSNSFGNDAEKDTAGCRALTRKYIVIGEFNPALILLSLLLIGGGGAFYYFKFVKGKSSTKGNDDLGEYDFEDEYEDTEVEYLDDTPKEDESV